MAIPTLEQIKALDFGYLTGVDLMQYCPFQLLQKQYTIDDTSIESAVLTAYSEVNGKLSTRNDITIEYTKTGTSRYYVIVKLTSLTAIRNLTSNLAGIPENMIKNFEWVDRTCREIQQGQVSLTGLKVPNATVASGASLISQSFDTIG
jgi:hypothetical protein